MMGSIAMRSGQRDDIELSVHSTGTIRIKQFDDAEQTEATIVIGLLDLLPIISELLALAAWADTDEWDSVRYMTFNRPRRW